MHAFVAATLRAMDEITADPNLGLEDAIAVVPELGSDRDTPAGDPRGDGRDVAQSVH